MPDVTVDPASPTATAILTGPAVPDQAKTTPVPWIPQSEPCPDPLGGDAVQREKRWQWILEAIPAGAMLVDRSGTIGLTNSRIETLFGHSSSALRGQPLEILIPERLREPHRRAWTRLEPRPGVRSVSTGREFLGLRADGSEFPVEVALSTVEMGSETAILGLVSDLSERRQAERHTALLAAVVESTDDAIFTVDRHGAATSWNRGAENLFGYGADEMIGQPADRLIPEPERDRHTALLGRVAGGELVKGYETRRLHKDGEALEVALTVSPLRGGDGAIIGASEIARDIRPHKHLENELRLHRDHLAELVERQVREMVAAKQEAETANQAKSRFLANMSHELRTPLHAILGFSKLALGHPSLTVETAQSYFGRIADSGMRLLSLLDDLLDLSKLEAGKMDLNTEPTDLAALTESVLQDLSPLAEAKQIHMVFRNAARDPLAELDGPRIAQVLRNVLGNAIRLTPQQGEIRMYLRAGPMPHKPAGGAQPPPGLILTVADTGPGIPEAEQEAIFDSFYQSSRTRTEAGGTGLGLAICREIVQLHGGTIDAANRAGGGATLTVTLPRCLHKPLGQPHV